MAADNHLHHMTAADNPDYCLYRKAAGNPDYCLYRKAAGNPNLSSYSAVDPGRCPVGYSKNRCCSRYCCNCPSFSSINL